MTTIAIIGLGLIGGSMALDLRSQLNVTVLGVDNNPGNAQLAADLRLVDRLVTYDEAIDMAEVLIIAIPVHLIQQLLPKVLDDVKEGTVVIDVGSTKGQICESVSGHTNRGQYVAAHPLAGTEFSGPAAAISGLFRNKNNIICDKELSDNTALELTEKLFKSLGMTIQYLDSNAHDKHMAYVSHLSHVSSFTLSLTVLDIEKDEHKIFNLASTGFESTARLAKSNPETWVPIFQKNNKHLIDAIDEYSSYLLKMREALVKGDTKRLHEMMTEANDIKRVLTR